MADKKCELATVSSIDDFWALVDTNVLAWIENLGTGTYEFSTDDNDLALKLRYLTEASKRFDSEPVFWELYHCEDCETSNPEFPFHVRISD